MPHGVRADSIERHATSLQQSARLDQVGLRKNRERIGMTPTLDPSSAAVSRSIFSSASSKSLIFLSPLKLLKL
jgi:hypothetical protein